MTTRELVYRIDLGGCVRGCFRVTINYRGKEYSTRSNDTLAYDMIRSWERDEKPERGYYSTPRQAYIALWNECKQANNLR